MRMGIISLKEFLSRKYNDDDDGDEDAGSSLSKPI